MAQARKGGGGQESFECILKKRVEKRKLQNALKESIDCLNGQSFRNLLQAHSNLQVAEVESIMVLKMTHSGYTTWKNFVCDVPQTAIGLIKTTLQNFLSSLCNVEISEEEVTSCYQLTKSIIQKEVASIDSDFFSTVTALLESGASSKHPVTEVVSPSIERCMSCSSRLVVHNQPSHATVFRLDGPHPALKISLKCKTCKNNVFYGYSKYGNSKDGYQMYDEGRSLIEASNETYIARAVMTLQTYLT